MPFWGKIGAKKGLFLVAICICSAITRCNLWPQQTSGPRIHQTADQSDSAEGIRMALSGNTDSIAGIAIRIQHRLLALRQAPACGTVIMAIQVLSMRPVKEPVFITWRYQMLR